MSHCFLAFVLVLRHWHMMFKELLQMSLAHGDGLQRHSDILRHTHRLPHTLVEHHTLYL